jgi:hypothetical protein
MRAGGHLLAVVPILQVDLPVSTTFPDGRAADSPRKLVYRSLPDWRAVFANCGFEDFEVLDSFGEAPSEARRDQVEALAGGLKVDSAHLLGKAVISVKRAKDTQAHFAKRELWLRRRILNLEEAYDSLPGAVEARLLALEAEARAERSRRDRAEQGLADRERELFAARRDLHALIMDMDYSRSLLDQAREAQRSSQAELDHIRAMVMDLGVMALPHVAAYDADLPDWALDVAGQAQQGPDARDGDVRLASAGRG